MWRMVMCVGGGGGGGVKFIKMFNTGEMEKDCILGLPDIAVFPFVFQNQGFELHKFII
jgi:hypothetical protein